MKPDRNRSQPTTTAEADDRRLGPLLALQFLGVAWVVANQFRFHLGLDIAERSGIVAKGYIGASLYFIAAGFIACDGYVRLREAGALRYPSMLWRRLTFAYPLHLATLAAMVVILIVGPRLGLALHHDSFPLADLPAHLMFAQAWGSLSTDTWNFPSWLVSADWFACIVLPVTVWVSLRGLGGVGLALTAPILLFIVGFEIAAAQGILFTDMTTRIGALQTVPAMLLGAALWRTCRDSPPSARLAVAMAIAGAVWALAAAAMRLSDVFIWPALGALVFGVAGLAPSRPGLLAWRGWAWLGRLSIAVMLVYLPVDMVYFRALHSLLGPVRGAQAWLVLAGVFPTIFLAAVIAYHGFQRPVADWLRARLSSPAPLRGGGGAARSLAP